MTVVHWCNITAVHPVYVVLEVCIYTSGAIFQCSPCVCSLRGVYTWCDITVVHPVYVVLEVCVYIWCNITVVHPVYVVLQVYTPGAILLWYTLCM